MPTDAEIEAATAAIADYVAGHLPSNLSLARQVAHAALAAAEAVRAQGWKEYNAAIINAMPEGTKAQAAPCDRRLTTSGYQCDRCGFVCRDPRVIPPPCPHISKPADTQPPRQDYHNSGVPGDGLEMQPWQRTRAQSG